MFQEKFKTLIFFLTFVSPAFAAGDANGSINPSLTMTVIMWVCILILLTVGYKVAWGPILKQINEREDKISTGLKDAAKATNKLTEIEAECKKVLYNAQDEAKIIIVKAKATAEKLAYDVTSKAQDEANAQKEKAFTEIEIQKVASIKELKNESAKLAIAIAGKILDKNLDDDTNRSLVNNLIKEI